MHASHNCRALCPLLICLLGVTLTFGCDDSGGTEDSGTGDSGTADSGTADTGTADTGTGDSGPADSGMPDSGDAGGGPRSIVTVNLAGAGGAATFDAVDESGAGVVITAGYALADGTVYLVAGDTRYALNKALQRLEDPTPLLNDDESGNITPDYMVAGLLGAPPEEFVAAMIADQLYLWQEAPTSGAPRFGAPGGLTQCVPPDCEPTDQVPFAPPTFDIVTHDFGGVIGLRNFVLPVDEAASGFMLASPPASFNFVRTLDVVECGSSAAVTVDMMTMSVPPGGSSTDDPAAVIVSGSQFHVVETGTACLSAGTDLVDGLGTTIANPRVVFGANFDGLNDNEEALIVIEDAP